MSDSLRSHGLYSPQNSPGHNTGVGSLSLLQVIFPTQGLNPGLLNCQWILYQLSHKGSPRILEWVAYPFSSGSSQPRNQTRQIPYQLNYQGSYHIRGVCPIHGALLHPSQGALEKFILKSQPSFLIYQGTSKVNLESYMEDNMFFLILQCVCSTLYKILL